MNPTADVVIGLDLVRGDVLGRSDGLESHLTHFGDYGRCEFRILAIGIDVGPKLLQQSAPLHCSIVCHPQRLDGHAGVHVLAQVHIQWRQTVGQTRGDDLIQVSRHQIQILLGQTVVGLTHQIQQPHVAVIEPVIVGKQTTLGHDREGVSAQQQLIDDSFDDDRLDGSQTGRVCLDLGDVCDPVIRNQRRCLPIRHFIADETQRTDVLDLVVRIERRELSRHRLDEELHAFDVLGERVVGVAVQGDAHRQELVEVVGHDGEEVCRFHLRRLGSCADEPLLELKLICIACRNHTKSSFQMRCVRKTGSGLSHTVMIYG